MKRPKKDHTPGMRDCEDIYIYSVACHNIIAMIHGNDVKLTSNGI